MSVIYRGKIPDKKYTTHDFKEKGIDVMILARWKHYEKKYPLIRIIYRSNGLCGEIRSCWEGKKFAVDVEWGWRTNEKACLTTECKSIREAQGILYLWFEKKGFVVPKKLTDNDWSKAHWAYPIKPIYERIEK